MNIFRIVQPRTNKRKQENSPYRDIPAVLLFVFLLPYVVSCLWGHVGEETAVLAEKKEEETAWIDRNYEVVLAGNWGKKRMTMQEYLIRRLEMIMPMENDSGIDYEPEALKAQAVLLRTELWALFSEAGEPVVLQENAMLYYGDEMEADEEESPYREAVLETDGIFLSYEGKPVKAAFFPISNGQTRSAKEALGSEEYPYLVSVDCGRDITAWDYQSQVVMSGEEYSALAAELFNASGTVPELRRPPELLYDSAGYVTEVVLDGQRCSGESFRETFGLNSASFRIEWEENEVIFHVKGKGHGFGMSQFGANIKAGDGEAFDKILTDYFFQVELVKIE